MSTITNPDRHPAASAAAEARGGEVSTTGHEWDGITELNNPLPRWWLWTFYATIVWALAYTVVYPAWPMLSSATRGLFGYSSRAELSATLKDAASAQAGEVAAIAAAPLSAILADEKMRRFAVAAGQAAFRVNCIQCHGSGAQGGHGYPNLNDDDWLWGGDIGALATTIAHGIRAPRDPDTRTSEMPSFADVLKPDEIGAVSAYVASLTDPKVDRARAEAGKPIFSANCAACHGEDAHGNREMGAPNLADAIWLYGPGEAAIAAQVRAPHNGVMPAWQARLGETTVKSLAVFVHSLGGGE